MRAAVIDIGSNSVRLLVADVHRGHIAPAGRALITTRLIAGMDEGMLAPDAMDRTLDAVGACADRARQLGAVRTYAFGTSAMRDARNAYLLVEGAAQRFGLDVCILSGEQEALYMYAGAAGARPCGVIDIGGGSTELLMGEGAAAPVGQSVNVGAVRLMGALKDGDPADWQAMVDAAAHALAPAVEKLRDPARTPWLGVAGTITTLATLDMGLGAYRPDVLDGYSLTAQAAKRWLTTLAPMDTAARLALPGMPAARADIFPYGAAILCAFFALSGVPGVQVSTHDNLEGCLRIRLMGAHAPQAR